ncbi:respiratory chain complex I subunit 1 family protein [Geothrix sp. 21YS21S-2]|uniref:respiratory chain complex I subunit 1 family protein n=1 Tax=Geothrix sp. 21YS21S-2 TaxID=3068893 RepID=UPI0027B94DEA|nr:NADH-quinone oxidoreductase subunit H [Geothrix sp. 21YS21S-2]
MIGTPGVRILHVLLQVVSTLALSPLVPGLINKVKAVLAGRTGPPVLQLYYDLAKLSRKRALFSRTTTPIFLAGPVAAVAAVLTAALLVPFGHFPAPVHFQGDAVLFVYLFGLARFLTILAALDTGSSFEGMGSAREATFSALAEPALFLGFAALAKASGSVSLSDMLASPGFGLSRAMAPFILVLVSWAIVFLAENARLPVDDPNTHLELTMIHEAMVLDHSGRPLALVLYGASLKLQVLGALILGPLLPRTRHPWLDWGAYFLGLALLAAGVGVVESVTSRLRMTRVPQFLVASVLASAFAFLILLV